MTVRLRFALLTTIGAAAFFPLVAAQPASAAPGCDWNTDEGTQACMGGAGFDAGKNGQGDTYGPDGEAGFLADNRMSYPRATKKQLLGLGYAICSDLAHGQSEESIQAVMIHKGVDEVTAGATIASAQMYLCPAF